MVLSDQQQPWKASFEEVPFVELEQLVPLTDILAALPAAVSVVRDVDFNRDRVGDVIYNNQCGCTALADECTRDQDCCLDGAQEGTVTCFLDPEGAGDTSFCSECRQSPATEMTPIDVPNPEFESCGKPSDCCVEDARCERVEIPYGCHWVTTSSGGFTFNDWICEHMLPDTAVCLPPLDDPYDEIVK
jgi:hypothetical protein